MNVFCHVFRYVLFFIRNVGREPKYPFEDDCRDARLKLHIGPWGSTCWRDEQNGVVYQVKTIDTVKAIADSMEQDIDNSDYQQEELMTAERAKLNEMIGQKSPKAIGFWGEFEEAVLREHDILPTYVRRKPQ